MSLHGGGSPQQRQVDLQLLAYELGLKGYGYRDQLIPQEFGHMVQVFFIFAVLLGAAKAFVETDRLFMGISLGIALGGICALGGFLVDIAANASSKRALRSATAQLEKDLYPPDFELSYWRAIDQRSLLLDERRGGPIFKWSAATGFLWGARLLFLLWIVLSGLVIFGGHVLSIK